MEKQPQTIIKTKKKFRKFKRIFFILMSLFLVVLITGIVLATVYEKEIKEYAIEEINSHLKAKLKIKEENISFSFFKNFPNPSLSFAEVFIEEENKQDTLLFAKNFSMEFSIGSVFSGIYEVKKMSLSDGVANLKIDKKGNENYIFWKQSAEQDTSNSDFGFKLKEVKLNGVTVRYINEQNLYEADVTFHRTSFSGDFSTDTSALTIKSSQFINVLKEDSTILFREKESTLSVEESMFHSDVISVANGMLTIEEMSLGITCIFNLKKETSSLTAKAENVEISDVFSLMPANVAEKLKAYKTKGKVNGVLEILTEKRNSTPKINVDFDIKNGTITEKNSGVTLSQLLLKGNFNTNAGTQRLEVMKGEGNLGGGKFTITGKVLGKETQTIFSSINGKFDLEKLGAFLALSDVEKMSGTLQLNNQFAGTTKPNKSVVVSEFTGTAKITNAGLKLKNKEGEFSGFTGDIQFNRFNSNALITGNYDNSDMSVNMQFSNFIPYLIYGQELKSNVYIQSKLLELDKLMGITPEQVKSGNDTIGVQFPKKIKVNLSASISKLTYEKHVLTDVSGTFFLNETTITTSNMKFNSNQGKILLEGTLQKKGEEFNLDSKVVCSQIEISDLLEKFNDFGQTVLRHDHLNGTANVVMNLKASANKHLELDVNSLEARTEFSVLGGVLKNLELFDEIGEYLKGNILSKNIVKVDELSKKLKRVEFTEFTNTLEIKNRVITIPFMMLKSSAMDVGIYGSQTFDYDINYGINMRLSDLLTKKKDIEDGYVVDEGDGARLFLLMTGTVDNPVFKLDKEGRKDFNKQQRQAEKNNVKGILKDEFGLFKKDSTSKTKEPDPKAKPKFEIEWEGENSGETKKQETPKEVVKKEEEKKKKKKWLDKLTGPKEKKDKVKFEVE